MKSLNTFVVNHAMPDPVSVSMRHGQYLASTKAGLAVAIEWDGAGYALPDEQTSEQINEAFDFKPTDASGVFLLNAEELKRWADSGPMFWKDYCGDLYGVTVNLKALGDLLKLVTIPSNTVTVYPFGTKLVIVGEGSEYACKWIAVIDEETNPEEKITEVIPGSYCNLHKAEIATISFLDIPVNQKLFLSKVAAILNREYGIGINDLNLRAVLQAASDDEDPAEYVKWLAEKYRLESRSFA